METPMETRFPVHRNSKIVALSAYVPRGAWVTKEAFGGEIDINNGWEVGWWAEALGCTRQQLCEAVKLVGADAAAVRRQLKDQEYAEFLKSLALLIRDSPPS